MRRPRGRDPGPTEHEGTTRPEPGLNLDLIIVEDEDGDDRIALSGVDTELEAQAVSGVVAVVGAAVAALGLLASYLVPL